MTAGHLHEADVPTYLKADAESAWEDNHRTLNNAMVNVIEERPYGMKHSPTTPDGVRLLVKDGDRRMLAPAAQVVRLREYKDGTLDYELASVVHWECQFFHVRVEEIEGNRTVMVGRAQSEDSPT